MSNNTSNSVSPVLTRAPPPSPEAGRVERREEGTSDETLDPTAQEDDAQASWLGRARSALPPEAISEIADSNFNFFVGPNAVRFTVDINDLRRQSALFRNTPSVTSVELRRESPEAVRLICNWFSGHIGEAPITLEERKLFLEAGGIAGQLQIVECAAQMTIIVDMTTRLLITICEQIVAGVNQRSEQEIAEHLIDELDRFMARSQNPGGEDGNDIDDDEEF